jgi:hypothetical protein
MSVYNTQNKGCLSLPSSLHIFSVVFRCGGLVKPGIVLYGETLPADYQEKVRAIRAFPPMRSNPMFCNQNLFLPNKLPVAGFVHRPPLVGKLDRALSSTPALGQKRFFFYQLMDREGVHIIVFLGHGELFG